MRNIIIFILSVGLAIHWAWAVEDNSKEASALAATGIELLGKGKTEKAQKMLYGALAFDSHCALALFELGKMFETEGNLTAAADFLAHASLELAKGEASNPEYAIKHKDAERRLQKLNPCAMQYSQLMEDYAQDLCKITKKCPDSLTAEEVCNRVDMLSLASILPKEKLPVVAHSKPAPPANPNDFRSRPPEAPTAILPDAELALKKAGWTTVSGTWKKKGEKIYEVTDGKLEAKITNGSLQLYILKGASSVKAFVRFKDRGYAYDDDRSSFGGYYRGEGYGVFVHDRNCKVFAPTQMFTMSSSSSGSYAPYFDHDVSLPDANAKNYVLLTIQDNKLEITVNEKMEKRANYPTIKDGMFTISIKGTATIEDPKAAGQ